MNKQTLPKSMKKQDMIEEYEILYDNYNNLKQLIDNQGMYIEVLMNMLFEKGVTNDEINNALDGRKIYYKIVKVRELRIENNILIEQLKVKNREIKLLKNKVKRLESKLRKD